MFQIDKDEFGGFIAELRHQRGMMQRELAEKLGVSDKAVSKWETGKSLPDITLLPPLAEELGVTVTELLSARRLEGGEKMEPGETEALLRRAVELAPAEGRSVPSRKRVLEFLGILAAAALEMWLLLGPLGWTPENPPVLWATEGMAAGFGAYFFLFARTRLPGYYDENRIGYLVDGFVRMHLPGVRFNNRTWPRILRGFRIWCAAFALCWPPLVYALDRLTASDSPVRLAAYLAAVFTLFIPAYAAGRGGGK